MSELFVAATMNKFRFDTVKGAVTTEDLWDMPLNGSDFSLNQLAKDLSAEIKAKGEEDFVSKRVKTDKILMQKFELVKYVIAERLAIIKKNKEANEQAELRAKARKILAEREESKLGELSDKELRKLAK